MNVKTTEGMKRLIRDCQNQQKADKLTTLAMGALEEYRWEDTLQLCTAALELSLAIEQRMALLLIQGLGHEGNEATTKEYLDIAYGLV